MRKSLPQSQSPLDNHRPLVEQLIASGKTNREVAREVSNQAVSTSETAIRRALNRWGVQRESLLDGPQNPGIRVDGFSAEVVSKPSPNIQDTRRLIEKHGLDPDDYVESSVTLNEWDSPTGELLHQVKINLRRKPSLALPKPAERERGAYVKPDIPRRSTNGNGALVVFTGDQQAPFHDANLHQCFLEWLKENKPHKGVLIGDTVDLPDVSRHRLNPENTATVQECINAGYNVLKDYAKASPETQWVKLVGNHDERIRNTVIDWAVELYNVKRAEIEARPESSVLSIEHLMRLDELGIDFLDPEGGYEHAQVNVSPYLAARHGWLASKGSGTSALKTLEHLGYSIIVGHTHRQSLVHKTTHDIQGSTTTLAGAEAGCMCQVKEGLGYAVAPDWQQGYCTATVWPEGTFKIDLATYIDGTLYWRDKRYGT